MVINIDISIIIPVYNVEKYIQRCLESVLQQCSNNTVIECIIIDDCSPDRSMDIVFQITNNYKGPIHFNILRNEHNCGLSEVRNIGIKAATGNFLVFLDSDDYLKENCIKNLWEGHQLHPEADLIIGNTLERLTNKSLYSISTPLFINNGIDARRWILKEKKCFVWNKLIRRQTIIEHHVYFIPNIVFEDIAWTYLLFRNVTSIYILNDITHVYEYNDKSITKLSSQNANRHVISYTTTCQEMLKHDYESSLFVQQHLFIFWAILNAVDYNEKYIIPFQTKVSLRETKKQLMIKTIRKGRIILASYFLLMYHPLCKLTHCHFFRHHYITISNIVEKIATSFNWLHT